MHALTVLYGASLASQAFEPVFGGKSAFSLAIKQAAAFPGSEKTMLLANEGDISGLPGSFFEETNVTVVKKPAWTVSELLKTLSEASSGYDFAYYAWADSPFLDAPLAGRIAERHTRYAAEYSFADGWPGGLGPELVNSETAGILFKIAGEAGAGPVRRDSIFSVLQKDINSFDIETEISMEDLRHFRLSFTADSKRNLLLLERFAEIFLSDAAKNESYADDAAKIIAGHPEYLRTLPAFFPIQVSGPCPQKTTASCSLCPYPQFGAKGGSVYERADFFEPADFAALLDTIEQFAGDGVIDLSLWGEIALHPKREELIQLVLDRPALSLIIETSGHGWEGFSFAKIAETAAAAKERYNGLPALSWIVSLDPLDIPQADGIHAESEAVSFVKKLVSFFPEEEGNAKKVYVEAVRISGEEDAIEKFYRAWKAYGADKSGPEIIIQKYDSFCGFLPQKQAVDLSPIERRPCWHILRDFPVYISGAVPLCREVLGEEALVLGNVFKDNLKSIWEKGEALYLSHAKKEYDGACKLCDEYYTYNF